MEEYKNRNL